MTINEGERLSLANFAEVPVNTRMNYDRGREGDVLMHENNMVWLPSYGAWYPAGQIAQNLRVVSVGYSEPTPESIEGFRQRLNTICVGYALMNSVAVEPVRDRLRALPEGNEQPTEPDGAALGVGMWVHRSDDNLWGRICGKRGVLLGLGNPNDETYKVWRPNGTLVHGSIDGQQMPPLVRVVAMDNPDTDMWLDQTPADPDRLARYKGRIWASAIAAKSDHSYCGQLEAAMYAVGISNENVTVTAPAPAADGGATYPVGQSLDRTQMNALPVGAVLQYGTLGGDWNWVRRSDSARAMGFNTHTLHLMGPNGGQYASVMSLVWDGRGDMLIPLSDERVRRHLPVGTEVSMGLGMLRFRKVGTNDWRSVSEAHADGHSHADSEFPVTGSWFIVSLPQPGV